MLFPLVNFDRPFTAKRTQNCCIARFIGEDMTADLARPGLHIYSYFVFVPASELPPVEVTAIVGEKVCER